ncbi:MAG: ribonuclease Z [Desulfobacteraceae bacterium]|nr:ribonuclease Z [Desulfobacteraceae bacterium]
MECILIGTGGMMPMPYRLLCSLAVKLRGGTYLFDAGEGTQINWKRARVGMRGLNLIAVTHLHADHCLGIPGMIMLRAQMEDPAPLTILGPPGIRDFVEHCRSTLEFQVGFPIRYIEWPGNRTGIAFEDERARISWQPLAHTRFCLGYRLEEHERPGKFDIERARALGVPEGPLWGALQHGRNVTTPSGGTVQPSDVLGPARRGRCVSYVVDTRPTEAAYSLCRNADLAFVEGMFLSGHSDHAAAKGHMTVGEAAEIAKLSGAARTVLVHISPRYENSELPELENEARTLCDRVRVGRDMDRFEVRFQEDESEE